MSSWRGQQAGRDHQERTRQAGMQVIRWLIGCGLAGVLFLIGLWCFSVDRVHVSSSLHVRGISKSGWALLLVSLAAATHFALIWSQVRSLRRYWITLMTISLAMGLVGLVVALFGLSP
jgi:hypothetical protein